MATYYFYDMAPKVGNDCLQVAEVLDRVAKSFPIHEFSPEEAREDARKRLSVLTRVGAPESLLNMYRDGNPVRCRIAVADDGFLNEHLEFDVWEGQGIIVRPSPNYDPTSCREIAEQLADILGYESSLEEYD